jgi:digeranylgeranylglycerophospholipid reductase
MSDTESYDVVVVGGGIAGCFAAATAAERGVDVVQVERKSEEEGGFIACGDAIKAPRDPKKYPGPIDMDAIADDPAVLVDESIDQIEWWDEKLGVKKELPYEDSSNVIDRYEFGQKLLDETAKAGVDQHYDTVVNEVTQNGRVTGIEAVRDGERVTYESEVLIDTAGAQSIIQDMVDFDALNGDTDVSFEKPHYQHFGSAYREIVETEEPVDYANAIVGKPLEEMGYIWYFPRTPTIINVGLGFQMSKEPIPLADRLKQDMAERPEFDDAKIDEKFGRKNKLGSSIALRRPLDSMVAPGYLTAGGAAATTHPISGKGIRGAALSGYSAGKTAANAVHEGDVSEDGLWEHNYWLFVEHGEAGKLASRDAYNVAASSEGVSMLRAIAALLPEEEIREIVGTEKTADSVTGMASIGFGILKNFVSHYRSGTFEELEISNRKLYESFHGVRQTKDYANQYEDHYANYPETRDGFDEWLAERNRIDTAFYDAIDLPEADRKY